MTNINYYTNLFIVFIKKKIPFSVMLTFPLYLLLKKILLPFMTLNQSHIDFINNSAVAENFYGVSISFKVYENFIVVTNYTLILFTFFFLMNFYSRFLIDLFNKEMFLHWYDFKHTKIPFKKDALELILGQVHEPLETDYVLKPKWKAISGDGLFQNIFITGSIGTGKSIAGMLPITVQLIGKYFDNPDKKFAQLYLDVKGNFYKYVVLFALEFNRLNDLIILSLNGKYKYNPLHKPNLSEIELARRARTVLEMQSAQGGESYWLDKAEAFMAELFKLIRIYNNNYITFSELHSLGTDVHYREEKFEQLREMHESDILNEDQIFSFISAKKFFKDEFDVMDSKIRQIIVSELTLMTSPFVSDRKMKAIFSPDINEINFEGFKDVIQTGKIVVWKINFNKEPRVAKLMSTYLKLDYQKEIMMTLDSDCDPIAKKRVKVIVIDEVQECVTSNDAEFLSQSREPRAISVYATQSYTSILSAFKNDEPKTRMLLQSFINKIWLRSDDTDYTVDKVVKALGKTERKKTTKTLGENAKSSENITFGTVSQGSKSSSSGVNVTSQKEELIDSVLLSRGLSLGEALVVTSDGMKASEPMIVHLPKLFEGRIKLINGNIKWVTHVKEIFGGLGTIDDVIDKIKAPAPLFADSFIPNIQKIVKRVTVNVYEKMNNIIIKSIPKDTNFNLAEWILINEGSGDVIDFKELMDKTEEDFVLKNKENNSKKVRVENIAVDQQVNKEPVINKKTDNLVKPIAFSFDDSDIIDVDSIPIVEEPIIINESKNTDISLSVDTIPDEKDSEDEIIIEDVSIDELDLSKIDLSDMSFDEDDSTSLNEEEIELEFDSNVLNELSEDINISEDKKEIKKETKNDNEEGSEVKSNDLSWTF